MGRIWLGDSELAPVRILEIWTPKDSPIFRFAGWRLPKIRIELPDLPSPREFKEACEAAGGEYREERFRVGDKEIRFHSCVREERLTKLLLEV